MVSKTDIKGMDFETIEDWFEYIVLSKINGNRTQAEEFFNELSKTQKKDFIEHLDGTYEPEDVLEILKYVNHY